MRACNLSPSELLHFVLMRQEEVRDTQILKAILRDSVMSNNLIFGR